METIKCIYQMYSPENEIRSISALNMVRLKVRAVSVKARASTAIRWSGLSTSAPACKVVSSHLNRLQSVANPCSVGLLHGVIALCNPIKS